MGLPTKLKAGWLDYDILVWESVRAAQDRRYGETRHLTHEIMIDLSFGGRQAASTLLHEIFHVVFTIWNIRDEDAEEQTVSSMADGLSTIWRDNPEVFAWIAEQLK